VGRRTRSEVRELNGLEEEFQTLLPGCLRVCAGGRYGLFGQNDHLGLAKWFAWPEAERLRLITGRIQELRAQYGGVNLACEVFVKFCSLRGSNVPGEPKLAEAMLEYLASAEGKI